MALLLAVAARSELAALLPDSPHFSARCPEHEPIAHTLAGREIHICLTGVGPINAALALGRVLARLPQTRAVLNVGLAGSFDLERAPLGSVWRVGREIWPEYGLAGDEAPGADARGLGFAQWERTEEKGGPVWETLDLARPEDWEAAGLRCSAPNAVSLTVAGVSDGPGRAARLAGRYGALLENMEGFALALACARQGLPLLEIRVVSNLAGSRESQHRAFASALARMGALPGALLASQSDDSHA